MEEVCNKLRTLVQDCLAKHLYDSAIFYADKLTTMSDQAPRDAYLLAQAFYVGKQYRRAYALLDNSKLVEADIRCRYLAARCLANLKEWEHCLNIMGWDPIYTDVAHLQESAMEFEIGGELSYTAAMCLLRGQVFEAQENRIQAVRWYKAALRIDPFCYEAFKDQALQALVEGHMLTSDEEATLRESLRFREEDRWLHLLYRAKSKKHDQEHTMEATLAALEAPAPPPVIATPAAAKQGTTQAPVEPLQPSTSARVNSRNDSDSSGVRTRSRSQREVSPNGMDTVMQEDLPDEDAENAGKGGCGLGGNLDVALCRAGWHLHRGEYQACYAMTEELLARDPYALEAMPAHLAASLELGKKNELFLRSHKLVEDHPEHVVAWFAVGCYYQAIGRYDSARQYFGKATAVDPSFAPAWLGFGHSFAAQDESDQAMAAYRTASRLFPGLHQPLLGMGCEYARMNNNALAEQVLRSAHAVCPQDPQPCHELGCLFYRAGDYPTAKVWLQKANQQLPRPLTPALEPTIAALGHTFRKLRMFKEAAACFDSALSILPGQASTFAGLAYTYHLQNRTQDAIDYYHKALALRPEDTLVAEMLTLAMQDSAKTEYSF